MAPEAIATVGVRRSNQAYFEQISRCRALDCGCAYYSTDYPRVPGCNSVGEVVLHEGTPDPVELVHGFYEDRNLTCFRWIPAPGQDPAPLGKLLVPLGFERRAHLTYLFTPSRVSPVGENLRVLGARAMRRAYTRVIEQRSAEHGDLADELTAVQLERVNDPQYDGFVALRGGEPVGVIAVFQVGEIGRLCDLYVPPEHRRSGVATGLLHYAIQTARRWALRLICIQVAEHDTAARALVERIGFEPGDLITTFARPGSVEVGE